MYKRIFSILVLICYLFVFSGCKAEEKSKEAEPKTEAIRLTVALNTGDLPADYDFDADPIVLWLERESGCDLEILPYESLNDTNPFSGHNADIYLGLSLRDSVISKLGASGELLDLQKYYADRSAASKNFWEQIEANCTENQSESIISVITDPVGGAVYGVPTITASQVDDIDYQMWINTQWMDELSLEKPTNPEELYALLKAFQANYPGTFPLYGYSGDSYEQGADVINWLINQYLYFNDEIGLNVRTDGHLYSAFTTDEYREALQFACKLAKEGLLFTQSKSASEMANVITANNDKLLCGIFAGNLEQHTNYNSQVLDVYEPLVLTQTQNCVYNNTGCRLNNFIDADCEHPDEAFRLLMLLWSEDYQNMAKTLSENSLRINCCGVIRENEPTDKLVKMNAVAAELYKKTADTNNPLTIVPPLRYTEDTQELRSNVEDYFKTARDEFILGTRDPNSDDDWNQYLSDLEQLGLAEYVALAQAAYEYK